MLSFVRSVCGRVCAASLAVGTAVYFAGGSVFAQSSALATMMTGADIDGAISDLTTEASTIVGDALSLGIGIFGVILVWGIARKLMRG